MARTLQLSPIAKLSPLMRGEEVVAFDVGPSGIIYVVIATKPLDYRREREDGCSFAKTIPSQPQNYRVIAVGDNEILHESAVHNEAFNIHHVQPLPAGELLLVCGRSYYRGEADYDRNGRIYTNEGKFARDFLLGDGIQAVQATSEGVIWTSYFDEGIFGNYGWDNPIGASGLVAWDAHGSRLYEFEAKCGLDCMADCYALNVASDADVWCYYYDSFPLVRLRGGQIDAFWKIPIEGSHAFAISGQHALFQGGYRKNGIFHLLKLQSGGKATEMAKIQIEDECGLAFTNASIVGRGRSIYMLNDARLYRMDVEMAA
jgi:hypothetical protein